MNRGEIGNEPLPYSPQLRIALAALLVLAATLGWSVFGPHIIDDAYITFRYSRNFAAGEGLVYNIGERVQGSSTPLWSVFLGLAGMVGLPIPLTALVVSAIAAAGAFASIIIAARCAGSETAGWFAALMASGNLLWVLLLISGMETMLYTFAIIALFLVSSSERYRYTGLLAAIVCLIRYDGAIAAGLAIVQLIIIRGWRAALRESVIAALVYLPWFLFAWYYFGSPIPQTVLSKSVVHYAPFFGTGSVVWHWQMWFSLQPLWWLWIVFGLFGIPYLYTNNKPLLILPIWMIVFALIFFIKRTPLLSFVWYLVPAIPIWFLMVGLGILYIIDQFNYIENKGAKTRAVFVVVLFIVAVDVQYASLLLYRDEYGPHVEHREKAYRETALELQKIMEPGDSILTGEVGTLGWYLPDAFIIDGYALVSPEVYEIRKEDYQRLAEQGLSRNEYREGSAWGTLEMLRRLKPDYISARGFFLELDEILDSEEIRNHYRLLENPKVRQYEQLTFQRIK